MFELDGTPPKSARVPVPLSEIDFALTAQIVIAWAGESGEEKRLGWWRCDLVSEFGGKDLFRRLLPSTWTWAVLQAARETARRKDSELRRQDHDPDSILSIFNLGFELDEQIEERFQVLKRSGESPRVALPGLELLDSVWNKKQFFDWVDGHGEAETISTPAGRRLKGSQPSTLDQQVRRLVAGLNPPAESYPLPHFRRGS